MPEIKEGWARWLTETERETLRSWATGTRVWKLARTLAALWALVEKKDKALEAVLGAWLGSATPQEFWEKFSDENEGDDLWGDVAVACALTALTEEDILGRLGIYINED